MLAASHATSLFMAILIRGTCMNASRNDGRCLALQVLRDRLGRRHALAILKRPEQAYCFAMGSPCQALKMLSVLPNLPGAVGIRMGCARQRVRVRCCHHSCLQQTPCFGQVMSAAATTEYRAVGIQVSHQGHHVAGSELGAANCAGLPRCRGAAHTAGVTWNVVGPMNTYVYTYIMKIHDE